jgi:hypothetical protein
MGKGFMGVGVERDKRKEKRFSQRRIHQRQEDAVGGFLWPTEDDKMGCFYGEGESVS